MTLSLKDKQRLQNDFELYAANCLKIVAKSGGLVSFRMNEAQKYVHAQLEKQLAEKGYVRALVLKGRQQGMCYSPEMRVLTTNYKWVEIKDIQLGEKLFSVDEESGPTSSSGRKTERRIREAVVEAKVVLQAETYEVVLDNGVKLIVTGEHRHLCKRRGADDAEWREVNKTKVGDVIRVFCHKPEKNEPTYEDGWFGGLLDGEGSFGANPAIRIGVSQVEGAVLQRAKKYLNDNNIKFYELIDSRKSGVSSKLGSKPVHCLRVDRITDVLKILSKSQPSRFVSKNPFIDKKLPKTQKGFDSWAKVISITPRGTQQVIDLQTSEKTFICEGIVSHNSTYVAARYYHKITHRKGVSAFVLSHKADTTDMLFTMTRRYHDNVPENLRPHTRQESSKAIYFDQLDSKYTIGTAGGKETGRGGTIHFFHGCLHPDTLILNEKGAIVRMGDMQAGDLIRTHTGEIAAISLISETYKDTFKLKLKGTQNLPIVASGEHRFLTESGWKEVNNLNEGDRLGFPVAKIRATKAKWSFKQPKKCLTRGGKNEDVPLSIYPSFNLGRIMGLYLAEGSVKLQVKAPHNPSSVSFAVHRREVMRTLEWLKPLDKYYKSVSVQDRSNSLTSVITVYGKSFACFINNNCGRVEDKRVPARWDIMGQEYCRGLVTGYLSGDGHCSAKDRRIQAPSIRSAITFGMRDIIASLELGWAGITYRPAGKRNGRMEQAQWTLRITGSAVDKLANWCNWAVPARRNKVSNFHRLGTTEIIDNMVWIPIVSKKADIKQSLLDFEIDHPDHSFCLAQCASHNSEVGFWENAEMHLAGLFQAVPSGDFAKGTEIILESTANGANGKFYEMWQEATLGESEYIPLFIPWFWQSEYRATPPEGLEFYAEELELGERFGLDRKQLYWRRLKIKELGSESLFRQEYPNTPLDAFLAVLTDAFIPPDLVQRAQGKVLGNQYKSGAVVMGVDPSGEGDDAFAICVRHGQVVLEIVEWKKLEWHDGVAKVIHYMNLYNPDKVFIDTVGLGYGVYGRLKELGYCNNGRVVKGDSRMSADLKPEIYMRKRCEMWGMMREWFQEPDVSIPDNHKLAMELITPLMKLDPATGKIKLESKDQMKTRGVKSPNMADALALTFFSPVVPLSMRLQQNSVAINADSSYDVFSW